MVKSVVECSPDLTWALVAKNNVFIRRSRSATRQKCFRSFSAEAANVTSEHKFKFSGASTFRSSCDRGMAWDARGVVARPRARRVA